MNRQEELKEWVGLQYNGRLVKGTTLPYMDHLLAVARLASTAVHLGYEIGLCHDLPEDTGMTSGELMANLTGFGYSAEEAKFITSRVTELTDVFTAATYPELPKKQRKASEAQRLLTISPEAQTVKYADLIYNINWTLAYDLKKALKYLLKKQVLLTGLDKGDPVLRNEVLELIRQGVIDLKNK